MKRGDYCARPKPGCAECVARPRRQMSDPLKSIFDNLPEGTEIPDDGTVEISLGMFNYLAYWAEVGRAYVERDAYLRCGGKSQ